MRSKIVQRLLWSAVFVPCSWHCGAQSRATCLYSESFSGEGLPAGWTVSPSAVERLDGSGNGIGEFVAPWQVGQASQANTAGYFPVPDEPASNTFAMANDDAPPCDCAMTEVSLISTAIDLSASSAPALSYRVYHDGVPFSTSAAVWVSTDGTDWTLLEQLPAIPGEWQYRTADLGAFAGGPALLRFTFDDGGQWASGFAVDDVCVFDRPANDIALDQAWLGDRTINAFNTSARSLGYSRIPLEQQSTLRLSARIRNNGTVAATDVQVTVSITLNSGTPAEITAPVVANLDPLQDTLVTWETGYTAPEAGQVAITLTASATQADEETSDNTTNLGYAVTSSAEGNHAMALDNDLASTVCGTDGGFFAGCRFELIGAGSTVRGLSVRFGAGTLAGSRVHALLMDGTLNLLSSSASHTVSDADLALCFAGGSVYIPLDSSIAISSDQDVVGVIRCLPDSGALRVACGGAAILGSAYVIDATSFNITYPGTMPIVRLHFSDPVTGLMDFEQTAARLTISPGAEEGDFLIAGLVHGSSGTLELLDASGRSVARQALVASAQSIPVSLQGRAPGLYHLIYRCVDAAGVPARQSATIVRPIGR